MIWEIVGLMKKAKRKRIKLPLGILSIGWIMVLLPFLSFYLLLIREDMTLIEIIYNLKWYQIVLILLPLPIGIALLRVKKTAWYALILYGVVLILWNAYTSIYHSSGWNSFALVESVLFLAVIVYFLRKDISSPYFKLYPRGWRGEKRFPMRLPVTVNGRELETRDFSLAGFYSDLPNSEPLELGEEVKVKISGLDEELSAGVVRMDTNGVGIAFRNLTNKNNEKLEDLLKQSFFGEKNDINNSKF